MKYVCYNGFEHHAAIGYGNYASMVYEAFTRYLNWRPTTIKSRSTRVTFETSHVLGSHGSFFHYCTRILSVERNIATVLSALSLLFIVV